MALAMIPASMIAIHCDGFGGPDVLRPRDMSVPNALSAGSMMRSRSAERMEASSPIDKIVLEVER